MRLIDSDKLESDLILHKNGADYLEDIFDVINEQPTVDAVSVVRCNECRYANARTKDGKNVHCNIFAMWMSRECFCGYGKRKDENRSD